MSLVAWTAGFFADDFGLSVTIWKISVICCFIVCVPDWPFFNKNPIKWTGKETKASRVKNNVNTSNIKKTETATTASSKKSGIKKNEQR